MKPVPLLLIGGFLGAGKTTLLGRLGRQWTSEGKRVGLITNDQASNLVDTEILKRFGLDVKEVSGGCFCCRFRDLLSAARRLIEDQKPDLLIGEPVGSCTDLKATVLLPIQKFFPDLIKVSPFSVLTDPNRLKSLLSGKEDSPLAEKVRYIYQKQMEEADFILLNKDDTLSANQADTLKAEIAERFPSATVMRISALNGEGVAAWLEALHRLAEPSPKTLEVDYEAYAQGEALLGWLNASVRLRSSEKIAWKPVALDLLKAFRARMKSAQVEAAHIKLSLAAGASAVVGNLTSTNGHPFLMVQGKEDAESTEALLVINARVQCDPQIIKKILDHALDVVARHGLHVEVNEIEHFRPAAPEPSYRMGSAIAPKSAAIQDEDCTLDTNQICGVVRDIFKPKRSSKSPSQMNDGP